LLHLANLASVFNRLAANKPPISLKKQEDHCTAQPAKRPLGAFCSIDFFGFSLARLFIF
jgi:hypothetical protein